MPPSEKRKNFFFIAAAIERPSEVLPTPGGPTRQRIDPLTSALSVRTARYSRIRVFTSSRPKWSRFSTCRDTHFVTDYPGSGVERRKVYTAIASLVQEAKQHIVVESPYLVLRDDGVALMQGVLQRGVKLQFLTNTLHSTDAFYAVASLADSLDRFAQANLEVWGYDGRPLKQNARPPASERWGVHGKRAVFDDRTVVVGTYNMDPRSANLNSELIVICRNNPELAAAMTASLKARLAQSRAITGAPGARGYDALIEGADPDTIFQMRMVRPFASFLDFLL